LSQHGLREIAYGPFGCEGSHSPRIKVHTEKKGADAPGATGKANHGLSLLCVQLLVDEGTDQPANLIRDH
jgi:hypothetical protein